MKIDWDNGKIDIRQTPSSIQKHVIESFAPVGKKFDDMPPYEVEQIVVAHGLHSMSPDNFLELWLEYEGFIGYRHKVRGLIDAIVQQGMETED